MAMYFNTNIFLLAFFAIAVILFSGNNNMVVGHGKSCQAEYLQVWYHNALITLKRMCQRQIHLHIAALLSVRSTFHA